MITYHSDPPPKATDGFYVRHRTAGERMFPAGEWNLAGPFDSYEAAKKHWDKIHPNWQEGGVVFREKCQHCGHVAELPR